MTIPDDAHRYAHICAHMFTLSQNTWVSFEGIIISEHLEPHIASSKWAISWGSPVLEERCERALGNEHFVKGLGKRELRSWGYCNWLRYLPVLPFCPCLFHLHSTLHPAPWSLSKLDIPEIHYWIITSPIIKQKLNLQILGWTRPSFFEVSPQIHYWI